LNLQRTLRVAKSIARRSATVLIPRRAQLPLTFWWQRWRGKIDPELLFLLSRGAKRGTAVDVGANQGIYSYALARIFDYVEAFEPNDSARSKLDAYSSRKIRVHDCALSQAGGESTLHTPISAHGVEYPGWGSLDLKMLPPANVVRSRVVRTRSLDSYHLENVAFIKIDVEGHELCVLEGARDTIQRCRPMILAEVKVPNREAVWGVFAEHNYECSILFDGKLCGTHAVSQFTSYERENFFWIPAGETKSDRTDSIN